MKLIYFIINVKFDVLINKQNTMIHLDFQYILTNFRLLYSHWNNITFITNGMEI